MIYLLDTNIFVETKKRFAPIHVGLSFWTMINRLAVSGSIASIDKVKYLECEFQTFQAV